MFLNDMFSEKSIYAKGNMFENTKKSLLLKLQITLFLTRTFQLILIKKNILYPRMVFDGISFKQTLGIFY